MDKILMDLYETHLNGVNLLLDAHKLHHDVCTVLLQCQIHKQLSGVRIQEKVDTIEVRLVEVHQDLVHVIAVQGPFTDEANHCSCHFRSWLGRQVLKSSLGQVSILVERRSSCSSEQQLAADNALTHRSGEVTCCFLSRARTLQKSRVCHTSVFDLVFHGKLICLFETLSITTPHTFNQHGFKYPRSTQLTRLQFL